MPIHSEYHDHMMDKIACPLYLGAIPSKKVEKKPNLKDSSTLKLPPSL